MCTLSPRKLNMQIMSAIHCSHETANLFDRENIQSYSLFTFCWPRFESGSLRNGGMRILRIYFAVDGVPIEMYGESWITSLLTSDDIMLYMAGFKMTRGI